MFETTVDVNHVYQLMKNISKTYSNIGMHRLTTKYNANNSAPYIRRKLSALQ